ncbi:MAG: SPASM domain-containing protein [Desulfamplus sp.]|nr:SPASM domain-containing protein [Desulfamplus sp.]
MTRPTGYMNLDDFARVLTMFPEEQRVVRLHHFGETILHPQIDTMIKMVDRAGLISVISLNPATLNENISRKIVDAGPGIVCFSLDAFTDSGLRKVRGIKKTYHKCIELMDSFIKIARNSDRIIVKVIQTVALDENSGRSYNSTRKAIAELKTKYPEPDVVFYSADNTGFGDLDLVEKTKTGGSGPLLKNASPCAAPFSEVSVLWNGDVVLCCYDYDGFNVVGNIRDNTIEEIWKGKIIEKIREIFLARSTEELTLCSRCFLAPHNFRDKIPLCEKNWREERVLMDLISTAKIT